MKKCVVREYISTQYFSRFLAAITDVAEGVCRLAKYHTDIHRDWKDYSIIAVYVINNLFHRVALNPKENYTNKNRETKCFAVL